MSALASMVLARMRVELFTAAQSFKGEDLEAFWKMIDDVQAIRPLFKSGSEDKKGR